MYNGNWRIERIYGFFYLLVRDGESKTILQKRFKKRQDVYSEFYRIVRRLSSSDYDRCIELGFSAHYFDTVRADGELSLIEIRVRNTPLGA